jgi:Sulfotransferase domain
MRTFILGVGAQKAGTTWLFRYLSQSENYIKGLVKEYHLFDTLHLGLDFSKESNIIQRLVNNKSSFEDNLFNKNLIKMKSFYRDENKYFDYFDLILKNETDFSSDITPLYSCLSSNVLEKIKSEFKQRGICVKVVFLMREPITRLESSIKMGLRRSKRLHETTNKEMARKILVELNSHDDLLRSNYSYACQQIDRVFSPNEVFFGFYETLFSEMEVKRLAHFLNMMPQEFDTENIINSTNKYFKYSSEDVKKFTIEVQDRYEFVSKRFNFDISIWDKVSSNMVRHEDINTG